MDKGIFLDRDGVINEVLTDRVQYVNEPEQLHLLPGVGKSIKQLNDAGFKVFVVTNQGGIGLGYMTEQTLTAIHHEMRVQLALDAAIITDIAYCPHAPYAKCACRKPKPKMLLDLAKQHHIDLGDSYMIGDRSSDIEAGQKAGTHTIFIGKAMAEVTSADKQFAHLPDAVDWIIQQQ